MWADLAVIPCKASMFDARALAMNTAFVRQAQAIRQGQPHAVAVLTMVGRKMGAQARDAAAEIDALFRELLPEACTENVVPMRKGRGRKKVNS